MLRKRLERLEAQAAQPDGEDPPPGGGGGGGDGGGAGGKAAKDRERVRPDPPTPPDSDADSSEDDVPGAWRASGWGERLGEPLCKWCASV